MLNVFLISSNLRMSDIGDYDPNRKKILQPEEGDGSIPWIHSCTIRRHRSLHALHETLRISRTHHRDIRATCRTASLATTAV